MTSGGYWRRFLVIVFAATLAGAVLTLAESQPFVVLFAPVVFIGVLAVIDRVFPE